MEWPNNTMLGLTISVNRKQCSSKGVHFIRFNLTLFSLASFSFGVCVCVFLSVQRINIRYIEVCYIWLPLVNPKFKLRRSSFNRIHPWKKEKNNEKKKRNKRQQQQQQQQKTKCIERHLASTASFHTRFSNLLNRFNILIIARKLLNTTFCSKQLFSMVFSKIKHNPYTHTHTKYSLVIYCGGVKWNPLADLDDVHVVENN